MPELGPPQTCRKLGVLRTYRDDVGLLVVYDVFGPLRVRRVALVFYHRR